MTRDLRATLALAMIVTGGMLTSDDAQAQVNAEFSDGISADSSPTDFATGPDASLLSDLIFNDGFEGHENGGTSCTTATLLAGGLTYAADTTAAPNWMNSFGPLFSSSNDVVYTFVAGPSVDGSITPTASDYPFAMYLIPSCVASGAEPSPIGATATIGVGIDLLASGVISGNTYYLAVTGTASDGPGANGTLNFTTPFSIAPARAARVDRASAHQPMDVRGRKSVISTCGECDSEPTP